jgi:tryptophan-rich hypothetical protein
MIKEWRMTNIDRASPLRRLNPAKLLLSKWTAVTPRHREKHFLVTKVIEPTTPGQVCEFVELQAVVSRRARTIRWRDLQNGSAWIQGWR